MKLYIHSNLYISSLKVTPIMGALSRVKAKVEVVFNQQIRLGGIQLFYGQYGFYLSWPSKKIVFPTVQLSSHNTRSKILEQVKKQYLSYKFLNSEFKNAI